MTRYPHQPCWPTAQVSGQGQHPRLSFDMRECLLPSVSPAPHVMVEVQWVLGALWALC